MNELRYMILGDEDVYTDFTDEIFEMESQTDYDKLWEQAGQYEHEDLEVAEV